MTSKPSTRDGYDPAHTAHIRAACLEDPRVRHKRSWPTLALMRAQADALRNSCESLASVLGLRRPSHPPTSMTEDRHVTCEVLPV